MHNQVNPSQMQGMPQSPNIASQATHKDLGSAFSSVSGKGVYISFQWDMVTLKTVDPERNGKRERRLRLMRQPIGDPSTSSSSYITEAQAAEIYPAEWEYFSKYSDMPTSGTQLSELPGISASQIQIMNLNGLRSIEDILAVQPEIIDRIGFEGRYVHSLAAEWQKKTEDSADMIDFAKQSAQTAAALAAAEERAARSEAQTAELLQRIAAMESVMGGNKGEGMIAKNGDLNPISPPNYDSGVPIDEIPNPLDTGTGMEADDPLSE